MIKPFKIFKGYTYSDEFTFPTVRRSTPPFGMSQRHWNIMPEDLRNATEQEMLLYIEGWLSCRSNDNVNPYDDIRRRELWNRGYMAQLNRTLGPRVEEPIDNESQTHGFSVGTHNTPLRLEYEGDMDMESVRAMVYDLQYRYMNYVSINEQVIGFMEDYLNEHLNGTSRIIFA